MEQDNKKNSGSGNDQSSFAGTNPNKYGMPKPEDQQDNRIQDEEAQNVIDGDARLTDEEAERARRKGNQGRQ